MEGRRESKRGIYLAVELYKAIIRFPDINLVRYYWTIGRLKKTLKLPLTRERLMIFSFHVFPVNEFDSPINFRAILPSKRGS